MKEQIEKQAIEEMALIMCGRECCKICTHFIDATKCAAVVSARKLYNAGYRKIIRCKDCKRCEHRYPAKVVGRAAEEGWYCIFHRWYVKPDGFCSFAKMKGGAK